MTDALAIYNRLQKIHVLLDDGDRRRLPRSAAGNSTIWAAACTSAMS